MGMPNFGGGSGGYGSSGGGGAGGTMGFIKRYAPSVLGALAGGGMSMAQSFYVNRNSRQQNSLIQQANQQQLALHADQQLRQAQAIQNAYSGMAADQAASQAQLAQIQQRTLQAQSGANTILGSPVSEPGKLRGLNTIATSPGGDFSRPNLGRSALLGS